MNKCSPLISVIVPVYNVEKYLIPCVESILQQTYSHFELLLIDDGSTDQSGKICDTLTEKDKRIKVYHKKNGGLSDARNYGMEYAQGEYITFIDSDDTISIKFLEILITCAQENKADIVQCNIALRQNKLDIGSGKVYTYNNFEGLKQFLIRGRIYVASCAKLYKKELFHDIKFPYGRINEDNFTTYKVVYQSQRAACIDYALYWHRMREGSIMHTAFSSKNLEILKIGNEIREFLGNEKDNYKDEINYFEYRTTVATFNYLVSSQNYRQYITQKDLLREKIISFDKKNPFLSLKDKGARVFILVSPWLYRHIIKMHKERKSDGVKIG